MDYELQLVNLLDSYPSVYDRGFQEDLSAREEFRELASSVKEPRPERGKRFRHQEFFKRALVGPINGILIMDETGTGKTCEVVGLTEYVFDQILALDSENVEFDDIDIRVANFKQVVIIAGDKQKSEIRRQLVCNCTEGRYITEDVINAARNTKSPDPKMALRTQKKAVDRAISKFYFLTTYGKFSNMVEDLTDEELIKMYSDTIFWIDEAHNLLVDQDDPSSYKTKKAKTFTQKNKEGDPFATKEKKKNPTKEKIYEQISRVFHITQRSKYILATATPMINDSSDLIVLMNFILPDKLPATYTYYNASDYDIACFFPKLYQKNYRNISDMVSQSLVDKYNNNEEVMEFLSNGGLQFLSNNEIPEGDIFNKVLEDYQRYYAKFSKKYIDIKTLIDKPEKAARNYRGQIPNGYVFNNKTPEEVEPYFRGRITYIRAQDTGATAVDMGKTLDVEINGPDGLKHQSQIKVWTSIMSEHQTQGYQLAYKLSLMGDSYNKLDSNVSQAATLVFPDGYWGNRAPRSKEDQEKIRETIKEELQAKETLRRIKEKNTLRFEEIRRREALLTNVGYTIDDDDDRQEAIVLKDKKKFDHNAAHAFERYVNYDANSLQYSLVTDIPDPLGPWLKNIDSIETLSCKFASIIRLIGKSEGNVFVYSRIITGSGAIMLALCLEGLGFERFTGKTSMFTSVLENDIKPFCSNDDNGNRRVRSGFNKKLRYAILSQKTTDVQTSAILEAMNSYENRYGEYIRVLIVGRVGRDGINVSNVRQIHLIGPDWNVSNMYQARSRGLRATSHEDLLKEMRQQYILNGKNPNDVKLDVDVYYHAAIPNALYLKKGGVENVDIDLYLLAEEKDRDIHQVLRLLKQCAIGCQIHYKRNVRDTDIDYTQECDYDVCQYACVEDSPTELITSTYDVYYSGEKIEECKKQIENIFRQNNSLYFTEIISYIRDTNGEIMDRKYVIIALERIIRIKQPLVDRYGFKSYLREDRGYFYLDRRYPSGNEDNFIMKYYGETVTGMLTYNLPDIITHLSKDRNDEDILKNYRHHFSHESTESFDTRLCALNNTERILLVEAVIKYIYGTDDSNIQDPMSLFVLDRYKNMILKLPYPQSQIKKLNLKFGGFVTMKGRPPKNKLGFLTQDNKVNRTNIPKIRQEVENYDREDINQPLVIVHSIHSLDENSGQAFSTIPNIVGAKKTIRIFQDREWNNCSDLENRVMSERIQIKIFDALTSKDYLGIYGLITSARNIKEGTSFEEKLYLRNVQTNAYKDDDKNTDKDISRGIYIGTAPQSTIIDFVWFHLQKDYPMDYDANTRNIFEICSVLISDKNAGKLDQRIFSVISDYLPEGTTLSDIVEVSKSKVHRGYNYISTIEKEPDFVKIEPVLYTNPKFREYMSSLHSWNEYRIRYYYYINKNFNKLFPKKDKTAIITRRCKDDNGLRCLYF